MDTHYPGNHPIILRLLLLIGWGMYVAAGITGLLEPHTLMVAVFGPTVPMITNTVLILAAGAAMVGTILGKYQYEFVAAWFAAAALLPFLYMIWVSVALDRAGDQRAWFVTAMVMAVIIRAEQSTAHFAKMRLLAGRNGT